MHVWDRFKRFGKHAGKFKYIISLQAITVECNIQYTPKNLAVVWFRRNRRLTSKPISCQQLDENNLNVFSHVWLTPEDVEFVATLYRDKQVTSYGTKQWNCQLEEVGKRRRILATYEIDLSDFTCPNAGQADVKMELRSTDHNKLKSATLSITLHWMLLKEGDATEEDMFSMTSVASLCRTGSLNLGRGLTISEAGGIGTPHSQRWASTRYPPGHRLPKISLDNDDGEDSESQEKPTPTKTFHSHLSDFTAKVQELTRPSEKDAAMVHEDKTDSSMPNHLDALNSKKPTTTARLDQDLLIWCQDVTRSYHPRVRIVDLTTSFHSGLGFCAILHHFHPDKIDFKSLTEDDPIRNCRLAFELATTLGIPPLLNPSDLTNRDRPVDLLSMMTYLHQLRTQLTKPAAVVNRDNWGEEELQKSTNLDQYNGHLKVNARRASETAYPKEEHAFSTPEHLPHHSSRRRSTEDINREPGSHQRSIRTKLIGSSIPPARQDLMLAKARSILDQTRKTNQSSAQTPPYTDALPPISNAHKARPVSIAISNVSEELDKRRSRSGSLTGVSPSSPSATTLPTSQHQSESRSGRKSRSRTNLLHFNPDGTILPTNGLSSPASLSPSHVSKTGPGEDEFRTRRVLHHGHMITLFDSGRGRMAPVPIRIGEHHFSRTPQPTPPASTKAYRSEAINLNGSQSPQEPPLKEKISPKWTSVADPESLSHNMIAPLVNGTAPTPTPDAQLENIRRELVELNEAQARLDEEGMQFEPYMRQLMEESLKSEKTERAYRLWCKMIDRKNDLLHQIHHLNLMEKYCSLEKEQQEVTDELYKLDLIPNWAKSENDRRQEKTRRDRLFQLVDERNRIVHEMDQRSKEACEAGSPTQSNYNYSDRRVKSERCVLQ